EIHRDSKKTAACVRTTLVNALSQHSRRNAIILRVSAYSRGQPIARNNSRASGDQQASRHQARTVKHFQRYASHHDTMLNAVRFYCYGHPLRLKSWKIKFEKKLIKICVEMQRAPQLERLSQ
ncbi:hypothetical protein HAX54_017805, partial [Datura stramonium]|nr:hypothetical protein [Datura stramonium]